MGRSVLGFLNSCTENLTRILEELRDFEPKKFEDLETLKTVLRDAIRSIEALQSLKRLLENPDIYKCDLREVIEYPFGVRWIYCGCRKCRSGRLHGPYLYLIRNKKWHYQGKITQSEVSQFLEGLPYKIFNVGLRSCCVSTISER